MREQDFTTPSTDMYDKIELFTYQLLSLEALLRTLLDTLDMTAVKSECDAASYAIYEELVWVQRKLVINNIITTYSNYMEKKL